MNAPSTIDTSKTWTIDVGGQILTQRVTADDVRVVDGCLLFTRDGVLVRGFARDAWREINLDAS